MQSRNLVIAPVVSDRNADYQLALLEARDEHESGAPLSVLEIRLAWMNDPTQAQTPQQLLTRAHLDGYRDYIRDEYAAQREEAYAEFDAVVPQ